ncbi:MAG: cytochrome oxidase putative small subunit CydP [Steroidobacteraceae bacterium]|jgi:hypothetical protein
MLFRRSPFFGSRNESRAAWDVFAALALKLLLLLALYLLFFGPAHRPASDAVQTASAIVGTQPARDAP